MDPDRWQRVTAVFDAALLREPSERAAYVVEACADDSGLVADVQALLAGHERARGASTWNGPRPLGATTATLEAGARVGPYIIHGQRFRRHGGGVRPRQPMGERSHQDPHSPPS